MTTWTTRDGQRNNLIEMGDGHLLNAQRVLRERRALAEDKGDLEYIDNTDGADEAMSREVAHRGLSPLPLRSQAHSESTQGISALITWWPKLSPGERTSVRRTLARFLRDTVATDDSRIAADHIESEVK